MVSIELCSAACMSSAFPVLVYLSESMFPRLFRHPARSEWLGGVAARASSAFEMAASRFFASPFFLIHFKQHACQGIEKCCSVLVIDAHRSQVFFSVRYCILHCLRMIVSIVSQRVAMDKS